jgi:hypothetical protein
VPTADVERKRDGRKKKKAKEGCVSNKNKNHNLTAHSEITSKLLSMGETGESWVVVPSVPPQTMFDCAHMDAQTLVQTGMDM